jgi:hypothetical protein
MIRRHNISLAAYLIAAEEGSYFASGLHWTDLISGTQEKAWPYWSDFSARLGPPTGKRKRQPGTFVFEREFQFATVQLDCGSMSAQIDWHATEKTQPSNSPSAQLKSDDADEATILTNGVITLAYRLVLGDVVWVAWDRLKFAITS